MTKTTPAEIVRQVGHALYGAPAEGSSRDSRWMTALGRAIGRHRLTIARWSKGEGEPTAKDWRLMNGLIATRYDAMRRLEKETWSRATPAAPQS